MQCSPRLLWEGIGTEPMGQVSWLVHLQFLIKGYSCCLPPTCCDHRRLRIRMGMRKLKLKRPKKWAAPQCEEGKLLRSATFPQGWLPVQGHREACTTFPGLCHRYIMLSRETGGDCVSLCTKRKDSRTGKHCASEWGLLARWGFKQKAQDG